MIDISFIFSIYHIKPISPPQYSRLKFCLTLLLYAKIKSILWNILFCINALYLLQNVPKFVRIYMSPQSIFTKTVIHELQK